MTTQSKITSLKEIVKKENSKVYYRLKVKICQQNSSLNEGGMKCKCVLQQRLWKQQELFPQLSVVAKCSENIVAALGLWNQYKQLEKNTD